MKEGTKPGGVASGAVFHAMGMGVPDVPGHPNRLPFTGVLTLVDVASDKPPAGARGHRVVLGRKAAEAALPSLLGMGVDCNPAWDGHDARAKCGILTEAEIVGQRWWSADFSSGAIFPSCGRRLESHSEGVLGMSYELADAHVADMRASVWHLDKVMFTGAAILRRDKAAYRGTSFALLGETDAKARKASRGRGLAAGRESGSRGGEIEDRVERRNRQSASRRRLGDKGSGVMETMKDGEEMMASTVEALAATAETLERAMSRLEARLEAQQAELEGRVQQIMGTIESPDREVWRQRLAEAERQIAELRAAAAPVGSGAEDAHGDDRGPAGQARHEQRRAVEAGAVDAALASLPVEQRIAVKSQLLRAGLLG